MIDGVRVVCAPLLASYHDLNGLPRDTWVYTYKAYNTGIDEAPVLGDTGVRPVPIRRAIMAPNTAAESARLHAFRTTIETVNSQVEAMGLQRLHASTIAGFALKVSFTLRGGPLQVAIGGPRAPD